MLAYCEARRKGGDWDMIDIMLRRSTDGGKTWSDRRSMADVPGPKTKNPLVLGTKLANPADVTYNNPVAIADGNGAVHFLFCLEYMRCFYTRSDDHGRTWHAGDIAIPDAPPLRWPSETVVAQLADGRVLLNARSESDAQRRLVTTSADGATGWSPARFDKALLEPICMAGMVRYDARRILFSNPHNLTRRDHKEAPGKGRDRVNLSVKLSQDEAQTWPVNKLLEPGFSGYSDLAVTKDGTILCFYERGSTDGQNIYKTGRLTVARFNLDWLTDGKASPP